MSIASKLSNIGVPITTMADADTIGWFYGYLAPATAQLLSCGGNAEGSWDSCENQRLEKSLGIASPR